MSLHFEHSTLSPTQGTDTTRPNPGSKEIALTHALHTKDDDDDNLAPSRSEGNLTKKKMPQPWQDIGT